MSQENFSLADRAGRNLARIREQSPLIHNITNFVVMNFTANALLAMGASPVMAHAGEEVEEMVSLARALVLNIGTLSRDWIASMHKAGRQALRLNIPVVLDPVGSGATHLRTKTARDIIEQTRVWLVRGNASEIICAAFLAVDDDLVGAAASALAFLGLAGERAAETALAPGSFQYALLDALYLLTPEELAAEARVTEIYAGKKEQRRL